MARIVVLGGGIVGLSTAMLLTRQGHDVTVFEQDGAALPGSPLAAWQDWERRGVAQFRQPHYLHAAARQILDDQLPEVKEALLRAGGITFDPSTLLPPTISDRAPRAGDERFVTITGRRSTIEYAVASAAERTLSVVRGRPITGLVTGRPATNGIPHIAGVRTLSGDQIAADLVIDAMGRRSKLPDWLESVGARRPIEETEESGFIYYTRFFRATTGGVPAYRAGLLTDYPSFSLLTLPGDGCTWSVTIFILAGDPALKALRDPERWAALVRACPLHAHWLDGEPISDVLPMGGVTDRYRRFVVDGAPVATGIVSVGDAWACTNPVGGRGISIGLMHALGTAEVVRQNLGNPLALALAHDAMTEARVTPWYRDTVAFDRKRTAQINAAIRDQGAAQPTDLGDTLAVAKLYDAGLFRASLEIVSLLALPQAVMARPGMVDRIREVACRHATAVPPCPSRAELLRMVA
ncbi:MAG TPA: FAD-dependent oxidoreductase [Dehalococcoidia bacterium]|jgi:2-polyprenyl-6-methoxyphenol hydroxylase-like FAD-dependent oxidoreductase